MKQKASDQVKVLLAEDLASDAELEQRELKTALQSCIFRVVETRDAFTSALQEFTPDLIISDYKMPSFDGLTALRLAREYQPLIPFIIATGSMNEDTAVECMKAGADDYVIKEHIRRLGPAALNALKMAEERRQKLALETEARAQQHFIERITNTVPMAIYIYDLVQNRNIYFNRNIAELIGYSPEEIIAMGSSLMPTIMHPEDLTKLADNIARFDHVADGHVLELEYRMRAKDGQYHWLHSWEVIFERTDGGMPKQVLGAVQDVSARKVSEIALRESEDKFKYLFENSVIGISMTLPDGEMQSNRAFCEMLGYSAEELQGKKWQQLTHPEDIAVTEKILADMLEGKTKTARFEKRYLKKDGSVVWSDMGITLRRDAQGNPQYLLASIADITEKVQARLELQRSEQRFRSIFEVASIGIVQTEPVNGMIINCNNAYARITGYSKDELMKMSVLDVTYPPDRELHLDSFKKLVIGKIPSYILEKRFQRKDGSLIWVRLNVASIRDEKGEFAGTVTLVEDISKSIHIKGELEASEKRFRSFFEVASLGITQVEPASAKFLSVNEAYCRMLGYSAQELLGMTFSELTHPDDRAWDSQNYQESINQGQPAFQVEKRMLRKDGAVIWVHINVAVIHDQDGKPISTVAIVEDITSRKQDQERILASESKLRGVIAASADAIILTDPHGTVIEWNPAAEKLFRLERKKALGRQLWDVQFDLFANAAEEPDAYERLKQSILEPRKAGKGAVLEQVREQEICFKDGSVIFVESIAFIFNQTPDGWHMGSISRDVTGRKKQEEAVRQSEAKFRTLFNTMLAGSCVDEGIYKGNKMVDYRVLDINPSYERILNIKRADVVGRLASEIYAPHPVPFLEIYQQVADGGKPQEFEAFFPPAGKFLQITVSSPAKGRFSTVFSDITEKRQSAEELKQKVEELQRFHDVTVDRELRMVELKREVNELLRQAGKAERYKGAK